MAARASRFFIDQDLRVDRDMDLSGQPAHHILRVLRLRQGDELVLFNGRGGEYVARISEVRRDSVSVTLLTYDPVERESPLTTELGLGIVKRDAMDIAIRKSTELGVTTIVPLLADYTTVAGKQAHKRFDHWREVIASACQQCGRNRLPAIEPIVSIDTWLDSASAELRLIADLSAERGLATFTGTPASVALLTGPEGGLSKREVARARDRGFQAVSLGSRILRAETAPLALLSVVQHRWGDV